MPQLSLLSHEFSCFKTSSVFDAIVNAPIAIVKILLFFIRAFLLTVPSYSKLESCFLLSVCHMYSRSPLFFPPFHYVVCLLLRNLHCFIQFSACLLKMLSGILKQRNFIFLFNVFQIPDQMLLNVLPANISRRLKQFLYGNAVFEKLKDIVRKILCGEQIDSFRWKCHIKVHLSVLGVCAGNHCSFHFIFPFCFAVDLLFYQRYRVYSTHFRFFRKNFCGFSKNEKSLSLEIREGFLFSKIKILHFTANVECSEEYK